MEDRDLIIGELREFKRATLERLERMEKKFDGSQERMDSFKKFRSKLVAAATAGAMLMSMLIEALKHVPYSKGN